MAIQYAGVARGRGPTPASPKGLDRANARAGFAEEVRRERVTQVIRSPSFRRLLGETRLPWTASHDGLVPMKDDREPARSQRDAGHHARGRKGPDDL